MKNRSLESDEFSAGVMPDYHKLLLPFLDKEKNSVIGLFKSIAAKLFPPEASMADLPSAQLSDELFAAFRKWINEKLPSPSKATTVFFSSYLDDSAGEAVVRGKRPERDIMPESGQWRLLFIFSRAGGTAETSSLLACHWVDLWFREKNGAIERDILIPHGLRLDYSGEPPSRYGLFFPADEFGYALYLPPGSEINSPGGKVNFLLDGWLEDFHSPEETAGVYQRLKAGVPAELTHGICLCQMCAVMR